MGNLHAAEYAGMVARDELRLDVALSAHLQSNHYPPIPLKMIVPAKLAIDAANEDDWDRMIPLPEGVTHRTGGIEATASTLVEHMHLDCFIDHDPFLD
jgi:hypothetical protein